VAAQRTGRKLSPDFTYARGFATRRRQMEIKFSAQFKRYILGIAIAFIVMFLIVGLADAATFAQQQNRSDALNVTFYFGAPAYDSWVQTSNSEGYYELPQVYQSAAASSSYISLNLWSSSNAGNDIYIQQADDAAFTINLLTSAWKSETADLYFQDGTQAVSSSNLQAFIAVHGEGLYVFHTKLFDWTIGKYYRVFHHQGGSPETIAYGVRPSDDALYFKMTDNFDEAIAGGGSASIVVPRNTTTTLPDFDNWKISFSGVSPLSSYFLRLNYTMVSSSDPYEPAINFVTYNDYLRLEPETDTGYLTFPKSYPLAKIGDPTIYTWNITAYFGVLNNFSGDISVDLQTNNFTYYADAPTSTIETTGIRYTSTSTYNEFQQGALALVLKEQLSLFDVDACSVVGAFDVWDLDDWVCAFKIAVNDTIFSIYAKVDSGFSFAINIVKKTFPLNYITAIVSAVENAAPNSQDYALNIETAGTFIPANVPIRISSSSTAWVSEALGFDFKDLIDWGIYAMLAYVLFEISLFAFVEKETK